LAFNEIFEDWRGDRGFVPYFYAVFPKRLATAVRRLDGRQPRMTSGPADEPSHDPGQAMDARAFVVGYVATLPRVERQLLALHVWEELPLAAVAEHLGLSLKETQRRWRVIRRSFRTQCATLLERDLSNGRPRRNPAT
jgi:DNA-directed RNA polymerase specialized sigma24 family protein